MGFSTCWKCGSQFWMPDDLETAARRDNRIGVFCASGHEGWFTGKNLQEELRRERDRLKQQLAEKDDAIRTERDRVAATERQLYAAKGRITKIKNRVGHGVCPCCNRTFADLQRHMTSKHADYAKSPDVDDAATVN